MAKRKKREFRRDKPHTGFLGRLYLTQNQRKSILKWFLYGLSLLVLSLLQDTVMCKVRLFGATTDLVPLGILLICVLQPFETSVTFGLVSSLLFLFSGSAPGPYCIVLLTFLGFGINIFRQSFLRKGFSAAMLCVSAAMLVYELCIFIIGLASGLTVLSRAPGFLATALMSLIAAPALYPVMVAIGKIGGESWKE